MYIVVVRKAHISKLANHRSSSYDVMDADVSAHRENCSREIVAINIDERKHQGRWNHKLTTFLG